ncbi:MAG: helix-turn-helix domain-containing protein [Atopobiaceae bacterium]|nr:helix-turn-helix domain-containing protein [Atopobiaceae bacterium]
MDISTDVLYDLLSQRYVLDRVGRGIGDKPVTLPIFYERGMSVERGQTYIAHTSDLPNKPLDGCLIICVGTKPPKVWNMWPGEVIYVANAHDDLMGVFNAVQRILRRLLDWGQRLQSLATTGGALPDMVEASIPIFENRITVTDYELRVLAYCEVTGEGAARHMEMSERYARVPAEKTPIINKFGSRSIRNREPYFTEEPGRGDNYCINLFLGDSYIGTCSLQEDLRPLRTSDLELFQTFAGFIRQALTVRSRTSHGQFMTLKVVFEQLLTCLPVSQSDMSHALDIARFNLGVESLDRHHWCCVVIQSANHGKNLPEGYLCETVENVLSDSYVIVFDDAIVAFCLLGPGKHRIDEICDPLDAYLKDMNFKAGISRTFADVFHARDFYLQAICALDAGFEADPTRSWYLFGDYALDYMLANCCGEFPSQMVIAPELVHLARASRAGGADHIETLRSFLDHDCNASRTAKAMFLHRSTLVQRLEKIREYVDLDDPDRRLYLRMCLHLPDIERALAEADIDEFA